jgi:hypothetical protein
MSWIKRLNNKEQTMEQIKQLFKNHDVVVLIGKCGSGKTYQSCQFIKENPDNRYIVVTNDDINYRKHGYVDLSDTVTIRLEAFSGFSDNYQQLILTQGWYSDVRTPNLINHIHELSKTEPNYLILDDCPVCLQQQVLDFTKIKQLENLKILLTCFSSKELVGLESCAQLMLDK